MILRLAEKSKFASSLISAGSILAVVVLLLPFRSTVNATVASLAMLLVVLAASTLFGSRPGLAAAVVGTLCLNFFFLPPVHTFTIADIENLIAFAAFIVTAVVVGQLSGYARRRAQEAEFRKAEIERLYAELREAFDQASEAEALRQSEKLKSSLLDAVTHELRTPLTSIKASATTLLDLSNELYLDEADRLDLLEVIDEETDRLDDFIENVIGVARLDARSLSQRRETFSVENLIAAAVAKRSRRFGERTLTVDLPAKVPNVIGDAELVTKALETVLDNAIKYSPNGSTIRLSAVYDPEMNEVLLGIEDQGSGIEPEFRETVFTKFYRGKNGSAGQGLGLGLAFARGIVESQGGHMYIADGEPGFSIKIVVALPADPIDTAADAER